MTLSGAGCCKSSVGHLEQSQCLECVWELSGEARERAAATGASDVIDSGPSRKKVRPVWATVETWRCNMADYVKRTRSVCGYKRLILR